MNETKGNDNKKVLPSIQIRGIEAKLLISNQEYQRPLNQKNIKCIEEKYIKELVNPVKVSLRGGKYYVIDGQHTLFVLIELFGENCSIPCIVYTGLTYEKEAELFQLQDVFKKILTKNERYKARYEAGDETIKKFKEICDQMNIGCSFRTNGSGVLKIGNYKYMIEDVFEKKGSAHLVELLSIIKAAYGDDKKAMSSDFTKGLDMFITVYKGQYQKQRLVTALSKISPAMLIRNSKLDMTHKGAAKCAFQIYEAYNKGLKAKLPARI